MENEITQIIKGLLIGGSLVLMPFALYLNYLKIIKSKSAQTNKYAYNTKHNHARTTGISNSGKISHSKSSCGSTTFVSSVVNNKVNTENDFVIEFKDGIESYTDVPQTRLHGGGWYS